MITPSAAYLQKVGNETSNGSQTGEGTSSKGIGSRSRGGSGSSATSGSVGRASAGSGGGTRATRAARATSLSSTSIEGAAAGTDITADLGDLGLDNRVALAGAVESHDLRFVLVVEAEDLGGVGGEFRLQGASEGGGLAAVDGSVRHVVRGEVAGQLRRRSGNVRQRELGSEGLGGGLALGIVRAVTSEDGRGLGDGDGGANHDADEVDLINGHGSSRADKGGENGGLELHLDGCACLKTTFVYVWKE